MARTVPLIFCLPPHPHPHRPPPLRPAERKPPVVVLAHGIVAERQPEQNEGVRATAGALLAIRWSRALLWIAPLPRRGREPAAAHFFASSSTPAPPAASATSSANFFASRPGATEMTPMVAGPPRRAAFVFSIRARVASWPPSGSQSETTIKPSGLSFNARADSTALASAVLPPVPWAWSHAREIASASASP